MTAAAHQSGRLKGALHDEAPRQDAAQANSAGRDERAVLGEEGRSVKLGGRPLGRRVLADREIRRTGIDFHPGLDHLEEALRRLGNSVEPLATQIMIDADIRGNRAVDGAWKIFQRTSEGRYVMFDALRDPRVFVLVEDDPDFDLVDHA